MADEVVKTEATGTEESTEVNEIKEETPSQTENETDSDEDEESEELSADDAKIAQQLYKAIRDPSRNKTTITNLAKALGIKLGGDEVRTETKAEDKETGKVKSIQELVNANLPDNWKTMGPVLAAVLEQYQAQFVEPKITNINQDKHNERSQIALDNMREKYKDFDALGDAMQEIAQEMPPGRLNNQSDYNKYVERVYLLAKGGSSGDKLNELLANSLSKTAKNAKRAKPGPSDVSRVKQDVTYKTPKDAVAAALKQMNSK